MVDLEVYYVIFHSIVTTLDGMARRVIFFYTSGESPEDPTFYMASMPKLDIRMNNQSIFIVIIINVITIIIIFFIIIIAIGHYRQLKR